MLPVAALIQPPGVFRKKKTSCDADGDACGFPRILGLVLIALRDGTHRFSDLWRNASGVSEKVPHQRCEDSKVTVSFFGVRTAWFHRAFLSALLPPSARKVAIQGASLADWIETNLSLAAARLAAPLPLRN
jgi:hypothetical protein